MMVLCGQSNRIWHYWAGKFPGSVGVLISPSYHLRVPIDKWMPFVLDNDAFSSFKNKTEWSEEKWLEMIQYVKMTTQKPMWAAVPDVVANKNATIKKWFAHASVIKKADWATAFCVQDGMVEKDVPKDADVVFVGGTDDWKFRNLKRWTENFPRVHCARVNNFDKLVICERLGCESVDGTGWFRDPSNKNKLAALERFFKGQRHHTPEFDIFKL